ncbi:uncharacterized protein BDV17DRAFT_287234 [Aspergillus undulatus]|uniref:uncharacterized protein n=1 Tax=Aspergillus undulatus TaxID=1810928 RepID=UPI003CCCB387
MRRNIINLMVVFLAITTSATPTPVDLDEEELGLIFTEVIDELGNEDIAITREDASVRRSEIAATSEVNNNDNDLSGFTWGQNLP